MSKRFVVAAVLAAVMLVGAAGKASALPESPVHPGGLGIGVLWGMGFADGHSTSNIALSLKHPAMPIFWGISLQLRENWMGFGVTGDAYWWGGYLVDTIFGWYLGLGLYGNFAAYTGSGPDEAWLGLGGRLPMGLTFQPFDPLEIFLTLAPSLGVRIGTGGGADDFAFDDSFFNFEFGIRLWF